MKKPLLIIALLFSFIALTSAQTKADSIQMVKMFGGAKFFQNDKPLKMSQLVETMASNERAYSLIKKAQSTNTMAMILGGAGGFMIGFPLGTAMAGGKPNWTLVGIGAGLAVVSIPISLKCVKQAKAAVDVYNGGIKTSSTLNKAELKFACTGNGIGLVLRF